MTRCQLRANMRHDLRRTARHRVPGYGARVGRCGHHPPFPVAREVMADQFNKFPCVVPKRDLGALIEDCLNKIGPSMQEKALRRGQFVCANGVFVARLALPSYHELSLHRRNRDSS